MKTACPLGRLGTPDEAAGAVLFFCCPLSDYFTGEVSICGGGHHFQREASQALLTGQKKTRIVKNVSLQFVFFMFHKPRDFKPMVQTAFLAGVK